MLLCHLSGRPFEVVDVLKSPRHGSSQETRTQESRWEATKLMMGRGKSYNFGAIVLLLPPPRLLLHSAPDSFHLESRLRSDTRNTVLQLLSGRNFTKSLLP